MILVDAIFSVYKYIDITVIFIASLFILWLSSICSGPLKLATVLEFFRYRFSDSHRYIRAA